MGLLPITAPRSAALRDPSGCSPSPGTSEAFRGLDRVFGLPTQLGARSGDLLDLPVEALESRRFLGRFLGGPWKAPALNHSLGLHSTSKQWCKSLPDVVLGPGTLEKGGYGLSGPGWESRV